MTQALLTGAIAFGVSAAATPVARRMAVALGMTDAPGGRRIHLRPIPRGGGVAVALAAVVACALSFGTPPGLGAFTLGGAALLLVVGFADDLLSLRPQIKLLGQGVAALLAVAGGVRLGLLCEPGVAGVLGLADALVTLGWIVFVTNAVNLSDGLDGLASGIGILACGWLAFALLAAGQPVQAVAPMALAGALLGFLVYNFNPASIFLGDAGSLLIGYSVAVLPIIGAGEGAHLSPLAAALLVAFPVTDTLLAIARRFLSRCATAWSHGQFVLGLVDGIKHTVSPDRGHIHHRLLDLGFSQRRAVSVLYLAALTTGALGYVVASSSGWAFDLFAVGLGIGVIVVVQLLGFKELQPARSGLYLPLLKRLALHRWIFVAVDVALVTVCYGGVLLLARKGAVLTDVYGNLAALALMSMFQVAAFAFLGVYRTSWRATGVTGFGLLIRACAGGAVAGYVALRLLELPVSLPEVLVYFFFLLSAVAWARFSYALLAQASVREAAAEPTLVCGTSATARNALAHLRYAGFARLKPIGFVEHVPHLQGRQLDQLPVLGTVDALRRIIREHGVTNLVIADPTLRGEAVSWVRAVCRHAGVSVHRYVEKFLSRDESIEELRSATDIAGAWAVLSKLFDSMGLDGSMLLVGPDEMENGNGDGRGAQVYAWRRIPDAETEISSSLDSFVKGGWDNLAAVQLATSKANGRMNPPRRQGVVRTDGGNPTVLRREGDGWRRLGPTKPEPQDILALPVQFRGSLWGVLLATSQAGNRVVNDGDLARIQRATMALGRQLEQWHSTGNDDSHDFNDSTAALRTRTARRED